jgi:hypothetical protein
LRRRFLAASSGCLIACPETQGIVAAQTRTGKGGNQCPLWVKSRHRGISNQCPLYPQKRTFIGAIGTSALGQSQTSAWAAKAWLVLR